MSLYQLLRARTGRPVQVGLIGAGKFGLDRGPDSEVVRTRREMERYFAAKPASVTAQLGF